jgi:predicted PurR-regulated permease PerM
MKLLRPRPARRQEPPPPAPASPEPEPAASTGTAAEAAPDSIHVPLDVRSVALTIIATLALILVLRFAQAMIIPIVLGVLISYALGPVVTKLTRWHVPRAIAAGLVLLSLAGSAGVLLFQLRSQVDAVVQELPEAARRIRRVVEDGRSSGPNAIERVQEAASELEKAADGAAPPATPRGVMRVQVEDPPIRISDYVMWGSVGAAAAAGQLILVLFLAYFLLASGDLYRRKLVKIVGPSFTQKKITVQILEEIDKQIEWFLLVQVFSSTVVGVTTWLAFRWIGLEQAGVWGLLAGIFNSIPYFGPVVVTSASAVIAFTQFGSVEMVVVTAGAAFAITTLEGMLLTPYLTSRAARMNAAAVFVGLIFWGWVWNVWGVLLAVPMLMVIKAICDRVDDFKPIGELLGE